MKKPTKKYQVWEEPNDHLSFTEFDTRAEAVLYILENQLPDGAYFCTELQEVQILCRGILP